MTDLSDHASSVPARLGVTAEHTGDELVLQLVSQSAVLHHGIIRASVLSFVVDAAAGIPVDLDPEVWSLTTDMSVRMRPVPAPAVVRSRSTVVRRGRRSSWCKVALTDVDGAPVADGVAGFATVHRRPGDPPKPAMSAEQAPLVLRGVADLERPLREEAGIEVVDPAEGVVEVPIIPELLNPAGTLQGAMVALVAEAATEDLVATRLGRPAVVVDLDLRYLARTGAGPIRTRTRPLGSGPTDPVEVELVDLSADRVTTLVYARAVPVPG